jgi:hypothetical protein
MGEKKRFVTFNLQYPEERELYEFSKSINLARLVKRALLMELVKSKSGGKSTITVNLGE